MITVENVNILIEDHNNIRIDGGSGSQAQISSKHETRTNWHVWIFDILRSQLGNSLIIITSQYKLGDNPQPGAESNIDCNNGELRENSLGARALRRSGERSVFLMLHSSPNMLLCLVGILSISD